MGLVESSPGTLADVVFSFSLDLQMLICVKSRINELEQMKSTLSDSRDLMALRCDKSTEENGSDQEAGKIKIVAKIFLNEFAEESVDEALEGLLGSVCSTTPSVIIAYHPTSRTDSEKFIWADNCAKSKANFKYLWKKLRAAQAAGKVAQLGIADMDLDTIKCIFDDEKFDFTILQINTQTCCVVPPELQQFCKDHDIQLLTHSDPQGNYLWQMFNVADTSIKIWFAFQWFFHRRTWATSASATLRWSGRCVTSKRSFVAASSRRRDSSSISWKR